MKKKITEYSRKYPIYVSIVYNTGWKDLHTKVTGGNDERKSSSLKCKVYIYF